MEKMIVNKKEVETEHFCVSFILYLHSLEWDFANFFYVDPFLLEGLFVFAIHSNNQKL